MKMDWNPNPYPARKREFCFWRIPIMKMDWNTRRLTLMTVLPILLTHSNYEDGLKLNNGKDISIEVGLLTHSNYEDGLKHQPLSTCCYPNEIFWRIPIMKMDWNPSSSTSLIDVITLLTHSNYEDGLKHSISFLTCLFMFPFDAFQLWRWIETWF